MSGIDGMEMAEVEIKSLEIGISALTAERDALKRELEVAQAACAEMHEALSWLLSSIPHFEGDDNLTEPVERARKALEPNPGAPLIAELEWLREIRLAAKEMINNLPDGEYPGLGELRIALAAKSALEVKG